MNDKCKYCDYVSKCSRNCEYDSILCRINRSFPKVVDKSYEQLQQENKQLKIQISARETLCEEYEQLINTILNFDFFKEECPLNFSFEDNSKEDEAQNIFYNDEYCENNCNDIYKDCWLKYFKKLQELQGSDSNEI